MPFISFSEKEILDLTNWIFSLNATTAATTTTA